MTTPLFRKIDCLSIPVPDLDAAVAFYSENLGHELIWRNRTAVGLRLPESNAELVLHSDNRPMEADLAVDSVPEALARFTSAGGSGNGLPSAVVRIANAVTNLALLAGIPRPPYNRGNALIVETVGRQSGKRRRIPVGYLERMSRVHATSCGTRRARQL